MVRKQSRRLAPGVIVLLLIAALAPVRAQDAGSADHPLMELLSFVPAQMASIESVIASYADYAAIQAARPGAPVLDSATDFFAMSEGESDLWTANFNRLYAGPGDLLPYFFVMLEEGPEVVGFDFFDIDRGLEAGEPPNRLTILQGGFDENAVRAAFEANGFETTEIAGLPALCSTEGCDTGMQQDLRNRQVANPFGGTLGRRQPMLVSSDFLVSSPAIELVEAAAASSLGESNSLLDVPYIAAAASAITAGEGELLQAIFVNSVSTMPVILPLTRDGTISPPEMPENYGELAPYLLLTLAERQIGDQQVALVALSYTNERQAEEAATEVASRLETFMPPRLDIDEPVISQRGGKIGEPYVHDYEDGPFTLHVAVVPITSPFPQDEDGQPGTSGLVFRALVQALFTHELMPVSVF